jgi:hypothetical protein
MRSIWFVDGIEIYLGLHKNIKLTGISNLEIFIFTKEIQDIIDENKSSMLFAKYFKVLEDMLLESRLEALGKRIQVFKFIQG